MNDIVAVLGLPFLACLLMTAMLGYIGLHVLKREIIFIDIAIAQVSALGAIGAHIGFHAHADSVPSFLFAFGATLVVAFFFAVAKRRISRLPIEATIGITYAIAAGGALFMIGKSTGGHTHVTRMLAGSLLWIKVQDIVWLALSFAVAGMCFYLFRHPLQRLSDSYGKGMEKGFKPIIWDFLFYALCGIVITVTVRLVGVVVVFCFLVIPSTVSALFAVKWRNRLIIAWTVGIAASLTGLIFSHCQDFSAGVSVALFLGLILIATAIPKGFFDCVKHLDRTR